ncbi:MAG: hypothetical protein ACE5NG_16885, partial [bacterium]
MKKNPNRFIASVLICCILNSFTLPRFAFGRQLENLQESEEGYLVLQTKHKGLEVRVDDKFVGFTPLDAVTLSSGL